MRALGIVQARLSSTRLPGKVLLELGGKTVLARVVEGARAYCNDVIVATSSDPSDDAVHSECQRLGVTCVRGSLPNVFSRFALALSLPEQREVGWFFRITADCPLHSALLGRKLLAAAAEQPDADYLYFADEELPRGLAPELVRRAAFDSVDAAHLTDDERQHVTLPFYRSGSRYRALKLTVPSELQRPELRLTLDYPEDAALFRALLSVERDMTGDRAVSYLLAHPELARINQQQQTVAPALVQEGRP
jgi:spore coat polysaccharide biosynthesis protein SpsF